jgi:intracellular septation protein
VIGYPQSDRAPPFVLQAARSLPRGLEQKGVRPRRVRAQQPVLPIIDHRVFAHVGKIPAHQREMMIPVGLTNFADAFERGLIADMTAERITRIGGVHDDGSAAQRFNRLAHIAALRGDRMQLQVDAHRVGYDTRMSQLLEWSPLIVFFVAFKVLDIYWATAALMIACVLLLLVNRLRTGKFKTMHIITAAVVVVLGTATLLLHDKRFIQLKPTVLLALTSIAFLGSMVIGKQPLVRRMLEAVFDEPLKISTRTWLLINSVWVAWFALLAVANIYVARNFAESVWVNFKVFGISVATMIFLIPQVLWLSGKTAQVPPAPAASRTQRLRERLESRFSPAQLTVEDESHLHEGHAGAAGGQSHFRIRIVSESFRGIPSVARHRLVYAAVDDLLKTDIHALAIEALPPD